MLTMSMSKAKIARARLKEVKEWVTATKQVTVLVKTKLRANIKTMVVTTNKLANEKRARSDF